MVSVLENVDLWDAVSPAVEGERGLYIALSGNTGAGKTTMICNVVNQAQALGHAVIGISERSLHHPYLPRMFFDPNRYAFPIQLNFMLHRHLVLLRQLELGRSVVIERSHFDDEMFMREHADAGRISPEQSAAYLHLATVLHAALRAPDILVLLNPDPEVSLRRLGEAEEKSERPREFPNEEAKERWVRRWHERYEDLHQKLADRCQNESQFSGTTLMKLDASLPSETNAATVLKALLERSVAAHA
jgi:deoxyadenosine/deoxycytidine kinase